VTQMPTGKIRRLQQCATPDGKLVVLAVDHRGNLRRALNPRDPSVVSDEALVTFKRDVVGALAVAASAVLLDPEYGAEQCVASGALPGARGLIVALERSGYGGDASGRVSELLPDWDPRRAVRIGASGVKLLVYYHPEAPTAAVTEDLIRRVGALCAEGEVPLFLEPLSYSPDPARPRLTPEEHHRAVLETARRLTAISGVDLLKAEFPVDIAAVPGEAEWLAACQELTEASRVPWVLLSAGTDFETYLRQVAAAARAGASGVAVGRAIWQEATGKAAADRIEFLTTTARQRMERVAAVCQELARSWTRDG
jgi:tagatose 1,6-diphosphate aldolase